MGCQPRAGSRALSKESESVATVYIEWDWPRQEDIPKHPFWLELLFGIEGFLLELLRGTGGKG
jgi:hypothetical protein